MISQVIFALSLTAEVPKPPYVFEAVGNDVTTKYQQVWNSVLDQKPDTFKDLKNYKVLFVRGYFGNWIEKIHSMPLPSMKKAHHYKDQVEWMKELGIEHEFVATQTESTPEFNIPIIQKAIEDSKKKVFLISQSKGGVDTLATLLQHPELQSKVVGWMPLNAAFQGTPIADETMDQSTLRWVMKNFFNTFGGSIDSIQSLTSVDRQKFLKKQADQVSSLLKKIPLISFASFIDEKKGKYNTSFSFPRNLLQDQGYLNDGLLPWQSSVLPGSDYVLIEDLDHATAVRYTPYKEFDRVRMTKALYLMIKEKALALSSRASR